MLWLNFCGADAVTTRRLILSEWLYILGVVLGAIGIIAGGLAYRQEQIDDAQEDERVRQLLEMVGENSQTLHKLEQMQSLGPRHTACDTKQILGDLRSGGKVAPHYPVEDRCNNAN